MAVGSQAVSFSLIGRSYAYCGCFAWDCSGFLTNLAENTSPTQSSSHTPCIHPNFVRITIF